MRFLIKSATARFSLIAFVLFFTTSELSRLALTVAARHEITLDASLLGAYAGGIVFDAASALFATLPWILLCAVVPLRYLKSKPGRVFIFLGMTLFTCILIFITTAEWFFWEEFSARFNFIAVDYLIWTQEVWGNITESYPMVPIFGCIAALAVLIVLGLSRLGAFSWAFNGTTSWKDRCAWAFAGPAMAALTAIFVNQSALSAFTNQYHGELAKNGCWSFFAAFKQMELDYEKWYVKLPRMQMLSDAKALLATSNETQRSPRLDDLHRCIAGHPSEHRWNVIIVCMESMSGSFMSYVGNKEGLTPNLDRLAKESIFFDNLYATGTRTVRGMEALTLNLPPTPGQAIIYRPEGTNLDTTFRPFTDRGYDCAFFYGGDGRFDFMNRYFSTSGARIMDANAWKKEDITMKTTWGACDEDMFHKTIAEADANHAAGKPFHFFCMTTSNHRPFDYPDGRVDIPSHSGRKGAVKYSDWAIGNLISEAGKRPWFKDTLFVIVSDHCGSSAGKMELDVTKYRIPAMIYNPTLVQARQVSALCSQIDLMPTVFGLMNWNYETLSFGHDLLAPSAAELPGRAFVSNYQKIALLRDEGIAILKPNRKVSTYTCDRKTGDFSTIEPEISKNLVHDATIFYQSASWLFNSGHLKEGYQQTADASPGSTVTDDRHLSQTHKP